MRIVKQSLLGSIVVLAAVFLVDVSTARGQACTAALDVDIHYCRDNSPVPCDPLAFTDGMPVELTVEVTNNSEFQPANPALDPPAGQLQTGATFKVYYSCSASPCNAGEGLADWFQFDGIKTALPGVSFVDDGNGYSGTITLTAPIPYAQGDAAGKDLLVLNMTAKAPPAIPGNLVFARAGQPTPPGNDSSDVSFLVTDPGCFAGLTGGGQGSTAGQFAPVVPGDDIGFCRHPNKQIIKIDRSGANEFSNNRVSFSADPLYDPSLCGFHFGYVNGGGTVYEWLDIGPGDLVPTSMPPPGGTAGCYIYKDPNAKVAGGVQLARVCRLKRGDWCVNFKGWADFDANLTMDEMPLTVTLDGVAAGCGASYVGPQPPMWMPPIWRTSPKRWVLPLSVFTTP